ncbi:GNAT family N-acetyltransferase [Pacificimonas flava]|uniref:GNAT family N-acetyltransferase n=2 Tax=Pacificimonas TaxID=1960290 RepID=A0A219B5N9_9SPHN|nr:MULTISPECIES: GNAT family N-acetyltransferase [Pacificimonas]MBZ6379298.1 GNAT family N-acetyltransferase [Pacificimonas aurantium]OWV33494.1 GNAT family N-acetyltransferase [Pacificimonas flava]
MAQFDSQPVLTDDRVTLRPLRPGDWDALFAVAADRDVWAGHPAHDRWREPVFRKFFEDSLASGGALLIEDASTRSAIGSSRFDERRAEPGETEIGWTFLARSHWGGQTNKAVKRLMLAHALAHYDRVIFLVAETNVRSQKAMERIGGRLTDRTQVFDMAGEPSRHLVYAIDAEDFAAGPLQE